MPLLRRCTLWCLALLLVVTACQPDGTPLPVELEEPEIEETGPAPPTMNANSSEVEGYPNPGQVHTGYILDRSGQPLKVTYEIHDGLAIWQGDIVLGEPHDVASSPEELAPWRPGPLRGVVIDGAGFRWPDGVVPYTLSTTDPPTASIVNAAIDWIEDQTPGVTLVERTTESDYVTFRDASGCSSAIGRQTGQQFINLKVDDGVSFCSTGNAAHEILHALGMYHEHTRCDRHDYVEINYDAIESGREGNFYKAGSDAQGEDCGDDQAVFDIDEYDFGSIMHYPLDAFQADGETENTIDPIVPVPSGVTVGQRSALSETDAITIDDLYGDNNAAPTVLASVGPFGPLPEGSEVEFDASGATDADDDDSILTFSWSFGDGTCDGPSPPFDCTDDDPDHTYADNDTYGYSVTVSDGFDQTGVGATLEITNVAPEVDVGADVTLDEGDDLDRSGSFDDPGADTWTATVDYGLGDGAEALALSGGKTFGLQKTYVDNVPSPVTVSVIVTDDDAGEGSDDVEVTVNNVSPSVNAGSDAEVESGETYDFSGSFSDPGIVDDPWAWEIDWGDGSDESGSTDDQSASILGSHQVCTAGVYTVTLTVTDKDDGAGSDDLTLTVPYIEVAIDILPGSDANPINLRRGGGGVPVAILGSPDFDPAEIDPATLTLGDESDPDTPVEQKRNGTYQVSLEDVNLDGILDLVAMFPARELVDNGDLSSLSTELVLRGFLGDACSNFKGVDEVRPLDG